MSTTSADTSIPRALTGLALLPLLLANFTMVAGTYAFIAIAGPMARELNLHAWHVGAIIGIVGLVWIVTSRRWGRAVDTHGRVPALRVAIVGYVVSYLGLAIYVWWALRNGAAGAPPTWVSIAALLATRAAMGGCFAGLPVAATAWIADHTAAQSRGAALARFGAAGAVGMVLAPPLAGWLGREALWIALAAFALLPLVGLPGLRRLCDSAGPREVCGEPPRLKVTDARIRLPWLGAFALYGAVMIANSALGFYVIDRLDGRPGQATAVVGYALGSAGLGLIATQALVGRLPRVAPLHWLRWGALVGAAGFVSVLAADPAEPLSVCVSYLVAACGMGASFPAVAALASNAVTGREQGACAGAMSAAQGLSMVIAPLVGTALYELHADVPFALIGVMLVAVFIGTWSRQAKDGSQK